MNVCSSRLGETLIHSLFAVVISDDTLIYKFSCWISGCCLQLVSIWRWCIRCFYILLHIQTTLLSVVYVVYASICKLLLKRLTIKEGFRTGVYLSKIFVVTLLVLERVNSRIFLSSLIRVDTLGSIATTITGKCLNHITVIFLLFFSQRIFYIRIGLSRNQAIVVQIGNHSFTGTSKFSVYINFSVLLDAVCS